MKRGSWGTVAVLLVAAVPNGVAVAQTGFNGVITFLNEGSSGKQDTFVQYTKGRKVRFDGFGSSKGSMIVDNDAKVMGQQSVSAAMTNVASAMRAGRRGSNDPNSGSGCDTRSPR